jgi:hypothetical protein
MLALAPLVVAIVLLGVTPGIVARSFASSPAAVAHDAPRGVLAQTRLK